MTLLILVSVMTHRPIVVARASHALEVPTPKFLCVCPLPIERRDDVLGPRKFAGFPVFAHGPYW